MSINIKQIKKLEIKYLNSPNYYDNFYITYDIFFKNIFSYYIYNINTNLNYLKIELNNNKISPQNIEVINNLNSLQHLFLENIIFDTFYSIAFKIKLYNIIELILKSCENITFEQNSILKIKKLCLNNSLIIKSSKSLFKFPNLEKCSFKNNEYNSIIDFSSLRNLKSFDGEENDFYFLENPQLIKIKLICDNITKKLIKKIILMKNLKKITLESYDININDISEIKGCNNSIEEINIHLKENKTFLNFYRFQDKFPNLSVFNIFVENCLSQSPNLKIKENFNCNVNNFKVKVFNPGSLEFYCQSFEKLKSVSFDININSKHLINIFPIFSNKCKVTFNSLISLEVIHLNSLSYKFLLNIYHNINNIPNLKNFILKCNSYNIKKLFYKDFINKILSLKYIRRIFIRVFFYYWDNDIYSRKELKEIFQNINFNNIYQIKIQKNHGNNEENICQKNEDKENNEKELKIEKDNNEKFKVFIYIIIAILISFIIKLIYNNKK